MFHTNLNIFYLPVADRRRVLQYDSMQILRRQSKPTLRYRSNSVPTLDWVFPLKRVRVWGRRHGLAEPLVQSNGPLVLHASLNPSLSLTAKPPLDPFLHSIVNCRLWALTPEPGTRRCRRLVWVYQKLSNWSSTLGSCLVLYVPIWWTRTHSGVRIEPNRSQSLGSFHCVCNEGEGQR